MIPLHSPDRGRSPYATAPRAAEAVERKLAPAAGFTHAVLVNSPVIALAISLRALRLPPGSEVVVPAVGSARAAEAVQWAGLKAVPAGVDAEGCLTVEAVNRALTPETRAILNSDTFGRQGADLKALSLRTGIYLIEEGHFGLPNRKPNAFTLAFGPGRSLATPTPVGAVLTEDPEMAQRVRELRGDAFLPSPFEARAIEEALPRMGNALALRRSLAQWYLTELHPWELRGWLQLPAAPTDPKTHVWDAFVIRVRDARTAREKLAQAGIETALPFPGGWLQLPLYPELTGKELGLVVQRLPSCLEPIPTTSSFISR